MSRAADLPARPGLSPLGWTTLGFFAVAALCLATGDVAITTIDPWGELGRMLLGAATPDFLATESIGRALLYTVAFALAGTAIGIVGGFALALSFHLRVVRVFAAAIRAVHELFWALIFLQAFGLSPLTGLLAIGIPYAGIIGKVFAEILDEADMRPLRAMPAATSRLSAFLFVRLPDAWPHFKTYALYRFECGLRSSAVLGFVGLPTLGFHLETAFRQGNYSEASALLILFYVVIATIRVWMRRRLIPLYLVGAAAVLPWGTAISAANIVRFVTQDIVPYPIRADGLTAQGLAGLWRWAGMLITDQALPGALATVQLTMIAVVATGLATLVLFPLISPLFFGRPARVAGHVALVVIRSTPEYILAFVLLQLWGPSMLPAIVALALHNGAIIGHLIGRFTETVRLRPDRPRGLDLYLYEALPRVYRQMLAFLFYRWEVIMRETAILGILGIATLGFYVDSAFAEIRADRALFLIAVTALLNIAIDAASRAIRAHLRLQTRLEHR